MLVCKGKTVFRVSTSSNKNIKYIYIFVVDNYPTPICFKINTIIYDEKKTI
jgi:hypothetical protein